MPDKRQLSHPCISPFVFTLLGGNSTHPLHPLSAHLSITRRSNTATTAFSWAWGGLRRNHSLQISFLPVYPRVAGWAWAIFTSAEETMSPKRAVKQHLRQGGLFVSWNHIPRPDSHTVLRTQVLFSHSSLLPSPFSALTTPRVAGSSTK